MKKIVISSNCVACAACVTMTEHIRETADGTVVTSGSGIVPDNKLNSFKEVIDICPVKAISLVDTRLTNKTGKKGLAELKKIIHSEFDNYKVSMPSAESYKFIKEDYKVPRPYCPKERCYDYKTYKKAEAEGLQEFNRLMYSNRKTLIQQILIQYKTNSLSKYIEDENKPGNYYYDINTSVSKRLEEFVAEAKFLSNGTINLPSNFTKCEFKPVFGREGNKFDREVNIFRLRQLEEMWFTDRIMNELEPLRWYDSFIDSEDIEIYDGKKERDMHCFDLESVTSTFAKHILDEVAYVLNSYDGIKDLLECELSYIFKDIEKGVNDKIQLLLREIDKIK